MSAEILNNVEKTASLGKKSRKQRKRGVTIVEAAAVMAIGAVMILGGLRLYDMVTTYFSESQTATDLNVVQTAVRGVFSGAASYDSLDASVLINTKAVPASLVSGATLRHAFSGQITVEPADAGGGANSGFKVTFTNIPQQSCVKMLTNDYGRSLYEMGASAKRTQAQGLPFTAAQAAASCNQTNNALSWTFN